ncbi:SDR family NAD(P)-dependent oxidoreductase [Photobacterium sanguinicancri]|uniref:SDR family NAD(P)-dependent oxidoreductase n=1 Tax=Photobacterium sanguinicancri TaxID=875932 RepID=A0AAW7Y421_9GAMM|nr:SDR family NAD(P)-dependent oxidoreductase [Photobacterium sanguinicancri]MDO6542765.1 SDR family NAD(P)-dependent oxidoreductase [Photobacterium sanguinicancri]
MSVKPVADVLITGASSGIGLQLALDYANQGMQVIACGQSQERLNALSAQSDNIQTLAFNVTDLAATQAALDTLVVLPKLIILNAGTCEYIDNGCVDTALFKRVFDVNVFGLLHCVEAMQGRLDSQSHLVFVGSTASYIPLPRAEAYGGSKAALSYIAQTLAIDLEHKGIKVTLVSPGFVKTPLTDKNDFPMPMLVTPEIASSCIRKGIVAGNKEIHFPKKFSFILKAIALLPMGLQQSVIKRMTGKTV